MAAILHFLLEIFLAIFDLKVNLKTLSMFQVNWPLGSGEEAKNISSKLPLWRPSWNSDRINFRYFLLKVNPMLPTKIQINRPFGSGEVEI